MSRRIAKGRFGASILDGMLQIDIDLPVGLALRVDQDRVGRYAGNRAARTIRKRLRASLDGDGGPLTAPKRRGRASKAKPGRVTGRLIRDVRFDRKTGRVKPESRRSRGDAGSRTRVRTSYAVMSVHISSGHWRDPMGSENPAQWKQIAADVEVELQKQLKKGALTARNRRGSRNGRRAGRRRR